uniref:DUF4806 domain-containing protein n=2 Tax=Trichobilharzia regenti TaxID=157069 RepID=A0AA85K3N9_TRIRE|nr:unnamed protein product [Trichobilharzia regenti]
MDIDVAASEVGSIKPQYPEYNILDDFVAPNPSTSSAPIFHSSPIGKKSYVCDRLPSNEDATESTNKKLLDTNMEIINLCTKILNIMTTDRKSRQQTYPPANGDLTLQFPLENEDQLEMLEASLRDEKYKQQYTAKMASCLQSDPKLSLKVMMHHVIKPEVGLKFTFQGTLTKSSIVPYAFYKIIRSLIMSHFSGQLMTTREIGYMMDRATKSYFHNLKDRVQRRKRKQGIQANEKDTGGYNSGTYVSKLS